MKIHMSMRKKNNDDTARIQIRALALIAVVSEIALYSTNVYRNLATSCVCPSQ